MARASNRSELVIMNGGKGLREKEPARAAGDERVAALNRELGRLKARFEREGLGPEEALGRLMEHAEAGLKEHPGLSREHRFSWISLQVERRHLPREEVQERG
jgi:hypothetical protein